jgi:hypothetical protein
MYGICVCDFCILKTCCKLEMRAFNNPRKELFSAAREKPPKIGLCYYFVLDILYSYKIMYSKLHIYLRMNKHY